MESDYPADAAISDAEAARGELASRIRAPRWYYWAFGINTFLYMVAVAWLPPTVIIVVSAAFAFLGAAIVADRRKRTGVVERIRSAEVWASVLVSAVFVAGAVVAVGVRLGPLPAWSGWLAAVASTAAVSTIMVRYDRALRQHVAAGR